MTKVIKKEELKVRACAGRDEDLPEQDDVRFTHEQYYKNSTAHDV